MGDAKKYKISNLLLQMYCVVGDAVGIIVSPNIKFFSPSRHLENCAFQLSCRCMAVLLTGQ